MKVGFSRAQWQRIREDYTAWWAGELDRALVIPLVEPIPSEYANLSLFMPNWPQDWSDDQVVETVLGIVAAQPLYGDAFPLHFLNFGAGVAAAFTGASLHAAPETIWFNPPARHELSDLAIHLNRDNKWWQRIRHLTQLLAERIGDRVQISYTDIGGNLDILASLRGTENLLIDCAEHADKIESLLGQITAFWLEVHQELHQIISAYCAGTCPWAPLWAPGPGYILQSDFSYMISPAFCARFVIADLTACCAEIEYPFYHMDGPGQVPHLDLFCGLEKLRGIQWVPGEGNPEPVGWPEVLGRIREAGKLCQTWGTPDEVIEICKRHGAKGFQFLVHCRDMSDAGIRRVVDEIQSMK